MFSLAVAVIMAVLDATRSIAAETLVLTPLGASWSAVAPTVLAQLENAIEANLPRFALDPLFSGLLEAPGFAVFAVLALLLALAGRRPAAPHGRIVWLR